MEMSLLQGLTNKAHAANLGVLHVLSKQKPILWK